MSIERYTLKATEEVPPQRLGSMCIIYKGIRDLQYVGDETFSFGKKWDRDAAELIIYGEMECWRVL